MEKFILTRLWLLQDEMIHHQDFHNCATADALISALDTRIAAEDKERGNYFLRIPSIMG